MTLKFHPLAEKELDEAITYYEEQKKGLGVSLLKEAKSGFQGLKIFPKRCPCVYGSFRQFLLRKFPYSIIYSIEGNLLFIIAVAHLSRTPDYWHDRVDLSE